MKNNRFVFTLSLVFLFYSAMSFAQSKPVVVSSVSMISDMTKNIAGDFVVVKTIVPLGGDPHRYDPTPGDAQLVNSADLILVNGLTFEGWINELIENSGTKANIETVTEGIKPIGSDTYENSFDPHAWMDVNNGLVYIKNIKNALIKLDPANRRSYEYNYTIYKEQLEQLESYIFTEIEKIPKEKRVLITSHDAFQYYGKRYGIQLEAILGTSTDAQVQTSDIIRVSNLLKITKVPAVFIESTVNPKLLQQIAKDNKVEVGGKLFSDSLGEKDSPGGSYYGMIKSNTDVIVAALSRVVKLDQPEEEAPAEVSYFWIFGLVGLVAAILLLFIIRNRNANKDE